VYRTRLGAISLAAAIIGLAMPAMADTIIVARGNDSQSLDPAEGTSFEDIKVDDWIFDGLTRFDGDSLEIVPGLAESWEVSDDGLVWTFHLREGVTFHDGTPFNAEAVEFSFERQRDPEHPYYNPRAGRWSAKFGSVEKTTAIDDMTVEIQLSQPEPSMFVNMPFYIGAIVSPTAVMADPEGFRDHPVGTGAFKFVRWEKDNFIELEANPDYYLGAPKAERVVVRTIPDNDVRLLALKKGEVHLIYGVPFAQFDDVESDPDTTLYTAPTLGISMMSMNTEREPFGDVRVRQAMNHAINRDRIFKTVFFGRGDKADQVMPPSWWGHDDSIEGYAYDPEKAKELLAEAGYPDGFETTLLAWTNPRPYLPSPRDVVALVKSDLANVGVDVDIQMMNWGAFREARGTGDYGMTLGGWISGTLDPHGMVYPLYHSSYIREQDALNWGRLADPELDALLVEAGALYDSEARAPLYAEAQRKIHDSARDVMFAHPITQMAARSNLKDVFIHQSNWVPLYQAHFE
jgi:peptide/nickel transport system substrate-binding protein